jgi:cutinase
MTRTTRSLAAAAAVLAIAATGAAGCTGGSTSGRPCTDVELVVARGTGEPGTLGLIVGDPLLTATRPAVAPRSVGGHAVAYPAGFTADSPPAGNRALVEHLTARSAACASTRFVLVGYSQGAQVVDMAIGADVSGTINAPAPSGIVALPASVTGRVAAVVLFGNPIGALGRKVPAAWQGRTLDICATGDPVCQPGGADIGAHLTYSANAGQAATFIGQKVR